MTIDEIIQKVCGFSTQYNAPDNDIPVQAQQLRDVAEAAQRAERVAFRKALEEEETLYRAECEHKASAALVRALIWFAPGGRFEITEEKTTWPSA